MIAPSSLSAFSAANGVTAASPATRVAAPARAPSTDVAQQKTLQAAPSGTPPSRSTPRGSLLDLSV